MMLPFWDAPAAVKEMQRCREPGTAACCSPASSSLGLPPARRRPLEPDHSAAQDHDMSINFHIGFSRADAEETGPSGDECRATSSTRRAAACACSWVTRRRSPT